MGLLGDVGNVESCFSPFGDSVSVDARQVLGFASNIPQAQKSFWTHPMELMGDDAQVDSCFSPFGDSANPNARQVHGLRRTYHMLGSHFGHTRQNSYVRWVMWNLILVSLETMLVKLQDRCTVCTKCTIGSEIVLDTPDGTPK